jgi:predicted ATPase
LLASLQRKEFLYEQPAFPEVEYTFKHALTQEVAYNSVLQERRKALHEQTAQAIENLHSANLDEHYSELAHHYSRSGNTQKAVNYLHLAGQQATQRSANAEAITHLTTALALLQTLPDIPDRIQQELTLQLALGPALMATKGYAAPEVETAYARARALCQQVGETPQLMSVLGGLWVFYLVRGNLQTAQGLAEQALRLAQREQDPALRVGAHYALGQTLFFLGEVASARGHLEQGIALYRPQQDYSHAFLAGQEPGVVTLSHATFALWSLGYPDQALERSHEALALAQGLSHPFSLAFALDFAAVLHQFRREAHAAQRRAEAAITLCSEQGFPYWLAIGTILQGWALTEQGQREEGMAQMRLGLNAWLATGAELRRPYFLTLLAEAYGKVGQLEEGLTLLAEALAQVEKTGECYYEAELYRLKGTLTLQSKGTDLRSLTPDPQGEAEACFHKAIEIARKQQAKSLELRASTSLARLWQQQGKKIEAHKLLLEVYNWFTEGFDTKDLQEAKALLEKVA